MFDLGGVLIENITFDSLNDLLPEPQDTQTLQNKWLSSSAVRSFELGKISPIEFAESFIAEWNINLNADIFLEKFTSWPRGFYPGALEALHILRRQYRIGCLSNSNVLHWGKFGDLKENFDIALASHLLGAIKPDDEAFIRTLDACDVEPSAMYFFDDSAANIHTASRLGIRAFTVECIAQLLKTLHEEHLLP